MRSSESSGVLIFADPATLGVVGVGLVHFHVESLLGKASIKTNHGQAFGCELSPKPYTVSCCPSGCWYRNNQGLSESHPTLSVRCAITSMFHNSNLFWQFRVRF